MNTDQFLVKTTLHHVEKTSHSWQTPSNIALVKYWGKSNPQIPKNASISFTLKNCFTTTSILFEKKKTSKNVEFDLFFEGSRKEAFKPKIAEFFTRIEAYCPYIFEYKMTINSENSFPHSSGIASSASGLGAIAICLMYLEKEICPALSVEFINQKASFLARLGSGSASRSIEGPLVVWGKHPDIENSSDLFGVKFPYKVASIFENYQDTILLVDKGEKQVSSTVGHGLMHNHPYAENRFMQATKNLTKLSKILQKGEVKNFIQLIESEALTLHAMMLTSTPYFILMKPKTLEVIHKIWAYRQKNDSNICFTLDAGANVHVLYPKNEKQQVQQFISDELAVFCQNGQYIHDETSMGAKKLE